MVHTIKAEMRSHHSCIRKSAKKAEFDIIQIYVELKAFFKNMFLNPLL